VKNPAEEGQVISTMSRSSSVTVKATSGRGNATSDRYSLKGFGKALERRATNARRAAAPDTPAGSGLRLYVPSLARLLRMATTSLDTTEPAFAPRPDRPCLSAGGRVARRPDAGGLADRLGEIGVPARERRMRAAQLWHWIYWRGARDFDQMSNVGKALRTALAEAFTLERPDVASEQVSKDGTRKWLLRMPSTGPHDRGAEIECVYIPESDRGTLCVSSRSAAR
jgi:hypothetical protein